MNGFSDSDIKQIVNRYVHELASEKTIGDREKKNQTNGHSTITYDHNDNKEDNDPRRPHQDIILEPYNYIASLPGKGVRETICRVTAVL